MKKLSIIVICLSALFVSCVTTTTKKVEAPKPIASITQEDIKKLRAEIAVAQQAVWALPEWKELIEAKKKFEEEVNKIIDKMQVTKKWKKKKKELEEKIMETKANKDLDYLLRKREAWKIIMQNN